MAAHVGRLTVPVLLGRRRGVRHPCRAPAAGAEMDAAGGKNGALYRLLREPRRLWAALLRNNPRFLLAIIRRRPFVMPVP
jgi:hypothetical protein